MRCEACGGTGQVLGTGIIVTVPGGVEFTPCEWTPEQAARFAVGAVPEWVEVEGPPESSGAPLICVALGLAFGLALGAVADWLGWLG